MGFFKEDTLNTQARALAERFRKAIKEKLKIHTYPSKYESWNGTFRRLLKEFPLLEVSKVLDWYCEHMGEEYVPKANDAHAFYGKYELIRTRMERSQPMDISKKTLTIASRLSNDYSYPVEVRAVLPNLLNLTEKNFAKFNTVLVSWKEELNNQREQKFLVKVILSMQDFPEDWMVFLSKKFGFLEHYIGDVMLLAFRPDSVAFKEHFWHEWSMEWCHDPIVFDPLLETLIKEYKGAKE